MDAEDEGPDAAPNTTQKGNTGDEAQSDVSSEVDFVDQVSRNKITQSELCFQAFEMKALCDPLDCPLKSEDETKTFKEMLQSLSARAPAEMGNILRQLTPENQTRVRSLLQTTNIQYQDEEGNQQSVARRIVRVVRRAAPAQANGAPNTQ